MKLLRVLKETFLASLPLAAVMLIVCVFVAPMETANDYFRLFIGYAGVVIGQSLFLVGLDISILPVGKAVGESLAKFKKAIFVIFFGLLFGFLAEAAEPALSVFASQTSLLLSGVSKYVLIFIMAGGIGCFVGLAMYRILKNISIRKTFLLLYGVVFLLFIFTPPEFIGIAFDGSGATTGDISVPFMLALGLGVSATMSRTKTNDDSFGIIGMASVGPILAVFIYGIIYKFINNGVIPPAGEYSIGTSTFGHVLAEHLGGTALALLPIMLVFLPFQFFVIKMPKKDFIKLLLGIIPVYIGLLIFLVCVDYGFAPAGRHVGAAFIEMGNGWKWMLLPIGFILGGAITLSEPAVTVLGHQLEELTSGHIKQMTIRLTLAIGIGVACVLCITKIILQLPLWYFLVPLYAIALLMMKFSSKLFVGLAFDSGGVSGGALTSAFLTPLTLGIAVALGTGDVLANGFGIIAFMSVTPLIAVQTLGILFEARYKKAKRLADERELSGLEELLDAGADSDTPDPEPDTDTTPVGADC
ncbi:MAG: DUF1538 domain-containing protein [Clostridiales bacterium]|nr:DUF1538 domain-containing protein [Clostridiales bacterium]